jgi:uncharacterized protein YhaN
METSTPSINDLKRQLEIKLENEIGRLDTQIANYTEDLESMLKTRNQHKQCLEQLRKKD